MSPSSVSPPTTIQAKLVVGGSAVHDVSTFPTGSSGPWTHFASLMFNISVVTELVDGWSFLRSPWYVFPLIMMMYCVDPSSDRTAQLECRNLGVSKDGPSVQLFSLTS